MAQPVRKWLTKEKSGCFLFPLYFTSSPQKYGIDMVLLFSFSNCQVHSHSKTPALLLETDHPTQLGEVD